MHQALLLRLMGALAGCSQPSDILTKHPLLSAKDAIGAPKLPNGVWRLIVSDEEWPCAFNESRLLSRVMSPKI
jgi:hypothetical protein